MYMPDPAPPTSIRVTRAAVGAQAVLCFGLAAVLIWLAVNQQDGDWADLAQFLYLVGAVYSVVNGLALGIPTLALKAYSAAPRITIVIVEGVTGGLSLLLLPGTIGHHGQTMNAIYLSLYTVGAVTAFVAATRPSARHWTAPASVGARS